MSGTITFLSSWREKIPSLLLFEMSAISFCFLDPDFSASIEKCSFTFLLDDERRKKKFTRIKL